jgi:hypothetical protein
MTQRPIVFLDFDEVIVLNREGKLGGYDLLASNPPPELWSTLFERAAVGVLIELLEEFNARVVLTTSWRRFMLREAFEELFYRTGLAQIATALHDSWETPLERGDSRCEAIDRWLSGHHLGEPYVILDDELSGSGLRGSRHDEAARVVLCDQEVGLHRHQLPLVRAALRTRPA